MPEKKRLFAGAAAVVLLGCSFHFLYDLFEQSPVAAVFFAVNESVWEHMKLLNTAALAWMAADWSFADRQARLRYFIARAAALPAAILTIPLLFYFFQGAFGIENLALDMVIFLFSVLFYHWFALQLEKKCLASARNQMIGIAVLAGIFLLFAVFSFLPPHLSIFLDSQTGTYGTVN